MPQRLLLLLGLLALVLISPAQDLIHSRQTSYWRYAYQLTEPEAQLIYTKGMREVDSSFFHTVVDSLPTDSVRSQLRLPVGHYLLVYIESDNLYAELLSVDRLEVEFLNNKQDLGLIVHDSLGQPVADAGVYLRHKHIPYDRKTQRYQLRNTYKHGLLRVDYQGHSSYFGVERSGKKRRIIRFKNLHRRILYRAPVGYLWRPVRTLVRSIRYGNPSGWVEKLLGLFDPLYDNRGEKSSGYLVFDQPKYRPGDTVHFKAWIANKKGKPLNKEMEVWLKSPYFSDGVNKQLTTLSPERKGVYYYEFVLADSLKLKLDKSYSIEVGLDKYRPYQTGNFYLEDYELDETTYTFRTDPAKHSPGVPMAFYAEGKDANDLNLLDANLELILTPNQLDQVATDFLFLPDTIWVHKQRLDPVGETKILLPDSLLPPANLTYTAQAIFTNAANERHEEYKRLRYLNEPRQLKLDLEADTLRGKYFFRGKSTGAQGTLYAFSQQGDTLIRVAVQLPLSVQVNPYVYRYELHLDSLQEAMELKMEASSLSCYAYRTADSIFVTVDNPRQLTFWYTLYRKNGVVTKGQGTRWKLAMKATRRQNYFVSLQYLWAGEVKEAEYQVSFSDKILNVEFDQPTTIFPGQTTEIGVRVTDVNGKPVPNTDLTAWGLTAKFKNYDLPDLEDFGKTYPNRKLLHSFNEKTALKGSSSRQLVLDYPRWNALTGLDSIAWFQFLYPDSGFYTYILPVRDSLAQVTPFVVQNGKPIDVHLLYIDEKLVYYRGADAVSRYTFQVKPGYHRLRIRTRLLDIVIDSLEVNAGEKLIFSIDALPFNPRATITVLGETLSNYDRSLLAKMIMPVRGNGSWKELAIEQDGRYQLLKNGGQYGVSSNLFGPFYPKNYRYTDAGKVRYDEPFEPGFEYEFLPHVIKMRSKEMLDYIPQKLSENHAPPSFTDSLLTREELYARWNPKPFPFDWRPKPGFSYFEPNETTKGFGKLEVDFGKRDSVLHLLLFMTTDSTFLRIYPGNQDIFHQLPAGEYVLVGLRKDGSFFRIKDLGVQVNGLNYYRKTLLIEPANGFSINLIKQVVENHYDRDSRTRQKRDINSEYRPGLLAPPDRSTYTELYTGRVVQGSTQEPLEGASVLIKNTTTGSFTDADGRFSLYGPPNCTFVVSYFGFETLEIPVAGSQDLNIGMKAAFALLEEVVVVGYGTVRKREVTGSVSTVQALGGRAAGVQVQEMLQVRGLTSIASENQPLYILDGKIVSERDIHLDEDQISKIEVLKNEAATSIYGAQAANGVVVITSKAFMEAKQKSLAVLDDGPLQAGDAGNSLRTNFHDHAFWKPNLLTGSDGTARFSVTFPDDITKWKTYAVAMGPKQQTGQGRGEIKSYKALMAQLAVPRFLVTGDTTFVIGKVLNYTPDTLDVTTRFSLGETAVQSHSARVITSVIDTFSLLAPAGDSLSVSYDLQRPNGYFDGEKRWIPLFPKGTEESTGTFLALDVDTTLTLQFDPNLSSVTLRAVASPLEVLLDEMKHIHNYRYLCNEQVASKLKSLLIESKVRTLLGEKVDYDNDIRKLVNKLQETQDNEGLWGWWAGGTYIPWISRHVIEALLAAEAAGYPVKFNREAAINEMMYRLERKYAGPSYRLQSLHLLQKLQARVDFSLYADSLSRDTTLNLFEQLSLIELKQAVGLPYALDTLFAQQHETLFGNLYWGEEGYHPYFNAYTPTLMAYRILRAKGGEETRMRKIRNYLFEQKKDRYWPNTYISASIMETILPEVVQDSKEIVPPAITLHGSVEQVVTKFPYEQTLKPDAPLTLTKTGTTPVYLSAFETHWNPTPEPVSGDFIVKSYFIYQKDTITSLTAGQPVTLRVSVVVKKLSEFMMVEVPIPAGCSYETKSQSYWRAPEVHREYFRDHTSIFCEKLAPGTYTFNIELLPRYSGVYTLNPARIEQMYFPIFYGRNELKTVRVE